ncbi:MAG: 30S ribosomal protein S20 [Elusimicrobia bacterium RIFOXYA2_FULL_58_8]|nr:MAG: 30S ribosomal protein S20 [Elusimicrobia bacterium RIFOXYA12_FULL_57_11]OGS13288.1 MAG: 30S ribosomal protein S20 [Elusimicrobia bacterium RIFOXYA2_FULL_58_8]
MAKLKTGRHTSAIKAWRKSEKLASKNRGVKIKIRDITKDFLALTAKKDLENTQKLLPKAYSLLDKAAKKGTLHWKTAARKKARLAARVAAIVKNPSVK